MVVASQHADARSRLPVPDADSLVIRAADDPGVFLVSIRLPRDMESHLVEKCCADIVQMSQEGEEAPTLLVVPNLLTLTNCLQKHSGSGTLIL